MEKNNRKTVLKTAMRLCLLFATLLLILAGCDLPDPFYIKVISIEGVPETGEAGTPLFLTGTIRPAFASNDNIIWSVTDAGNTGATISGNILNTQASGTVTIRAKIANGTAEGKEYTQDFEIVFSEGVGAGGEPVSVTGVTLNHTTLSMNVGGTATLTATVNPTNAANKNVTWSSSAPSIATVSTSGLVTAIAVGTATITVTTSDGGKTAMCVVTVAEAEARIGSTMYATLSDALDAAANGTASVPTEIIILRNITASKGYIVPENKNIKLTVESGKSFTITASTGSFTLFSITNTGSSLTLGQTSGGGTLTMSGGNTAAESDRRCVYVSGSGRTFTMNNGVAITGFNKSTTYTSGVHVDSDSVFIMNGGEISGNTGLSFGGGVYVSSGGTFTMNDGKIKNNILNNGSSSGSGGGVYLHGDFTMNGGEISGNNASYSGGGVYASGSFTMNDGEISGNTARSGGGVYATGSFTMNDGEISGNTASSGSGGGGGVQVASTGKFTMEGGKISGNTASTGGGVLVNSEGGNLGIFTMTGGTIYGTNESNTSLRNKAADFASIYSRGTAKYGNGAYISSTNNTITGIPTP